MREHGEQTNRSEKIRDFFRKSTFLKLNYYIAIFFLLTATLAAADNEKFTNVFYPLKGNFSPSEGTIEIWVRADKDLTAPMQSFYHFYVFSILIGEKMWGEGGGFALLWNRMCLYSLGGPKVKGSELKNTPSMYKHPNYVKKESIWKEGEWHHVAFSWKECEMELFVDGRSVAKSIASGPIPSGPKGWISIGHNKSPITVDELVISSVRRTEEEINKRLASCPKEDENTLILDHMETLDKDSGRSYQLDPGKAEVVDGKFGKAVKLHK